METHRLALPNGFQLENYELSQVLGKGGFGITYLGVDRHLGRQVAVKELMPDTIVTREGTQIIAQSQALAPNWEWAKERFLEEACMLAGFQNPYIVNVHQIIEANGTVYMVMDYIEGESYEARLRRIQREPNEQSMRAILEPLMEGLEEVHANGLLHRDIKPDNILLRRDVQPILLDFGSARKQLEGSAVMTSIVTHGYSPIEQYQIKGKQGPWTDIYALGAVAVRAITGEKPPVAADRMSEDEFEWLSYRTLEGYSPRFLRALDWALRVKPKERPNNIGEWRSSFGWNAAKPITRSNPTTKNGTVPVRSSTETKRLGTKKVAPSAQSDDTTATVRPASSTETRKPELEEAAKTALRSRNSKSKASGWKQKQFLLVSLLVFAGAFCGVLLIAQKSRMPFANKSGNPAGAIVQPLIPSKAPEPKTKSVPKFVNSLGMGFVPVPGTKVLFSVWDTREQDYQAFVKETKRDWPTPSFTQEGTHPAVNVSWEDAKAFCAWLSKKEKRDYRLPTDAEWSLAAGLPPESGATPMEKDGKLKDTFPWGTSWPPPRGSGNYASSLRIDDFDNTAPVDSFPCNPHGLYDMGGNVWQWCEDWFDSHKKNRVLRGGAWNSCVREITLSSFRYYAQPHIHSDNIGFRPVLVPGKAGNP